MEQSIPGDTTAARKRRDERMEELQTKENRCRRLLGEGLISYLEILKDKDNAYEMWQEVRRRFERTSQSSRSVFSREYRSLKYKPAEEDFSQYCLRFDRVVRNLRNAGSSLSETDVAYDFLWSLPREYEVLTSAIEANPDNVSLSYIRNRIDEWEIRTNRRRGGGSSSSKPVLNSSLNSVHVSGRKGRGSNRTTPFGGNCSNCGRAGHKVFQCWRPGGGAASRGGHHQNQSRGQQQHQGSNNYNYNNRGGNGGGSRGGRGGFNSPGNRGGRGGYRGGRGQGGSSASQSASAATAVNKGENRGYSFYSSEDNEVTNSKQ